MKIKTLHKLWIGLVIMALIGLVALSCRSSSKPKEEPGATVTQETVAATPDTGVSSPGLSKTMTLPTVTPPAPGEPTLPPQALQMRVAPTATPSPIPPSPSPTPTTTATPTSVPVTGYDDVLMVEVPAGEFLMGVTEDQALNFFRHWHTEYPAPSYLPIPNFTDQTPQLAVYLDTFSIDQVEVANARYRRCVQAGFCSSSNYSEISDYGTDLRYDDYPALVTWPDALAYCQWVGKRLPTEMEWEKAARGTDKRPYPWGQEWQSDWANLDDYPMPIGNHPHDLSPYGALDMGGNAQEWTTDWYRPYPGNPRWLDEYEEPYRVVRGSGRQGNLYFLTTFRQLRSPWQLAGFRCIQGPEPLALVQAATPVFTYPTPETTSQVDLSHMVYVPAGEFVMGKDDVGDKPTRQDEQPAHLIYLDAFYIDRYEVTVAEFATFLNTIGGHKWRCGLDCIYTLDGEQPLGLEIQVSDGSYVPGEGFENRPVTIATWEGARAYCEQAGKRLPTEAEWEKAARGTDERLYPWGNNWDPARPAGVLDPLGSSPAEVGAHPGDVSPYGVYGMLGNAPEWVADWYAPEYYRLSPYANPQGPDNGAAHVVRGNFGPAAEEGITDRRTTRGITGFRCVHTP